MYQLVIESGYFVQSFQKVEPGSTVRFTLMPASRSWAAIASPVFLCQSSSTVISSCSKSAWPASAISSLALAGVARDLRQLDNIPDGSGRHGGFRPTVPALP